MLRIFSYKTENLLIISCQVSKLSSDSLRLSEAHSELIQISKMEVSAEIFKNFKPLTGSTRSSILDDRLGSACASGQIYRLILHLYWPKHQKGLLPRVNGLMHLLKLIKRLCTKLVLALMGYILNQIFKMKYKTYAYWTEKKYRKMEWEKIKIDFENWF